MVHLAVCANICFACFVAGRSRVVLLFGCWFLCCNSDNRFNDYFDQKTFKEVIGYFISVSLQKLINENSKDVYVQGNIRIKNLG